MKELLNYYKVQILDFSGRSVNKSVITVYRVRFHGEYWYELIIRIFDVIYWVFFNYV